MRRGLKFYRVQAQLIATTLDGWESSRQVRTMIVGAEGPVDAGQEVSHLAWDSSHGGYVARRTIATVGEVINGDNGDIVPTGPASWVRVDYLPSGVIATSRADTYQQLTEMHAN